MANPALAPGIYAIINSRGNHALDTNGTQTVTSSYIGSTSQQWNISTPDGVGWYIQNVSSGKYLGLPPNLRAQNNEGLQEVAHMFVWHLNRKGSDFTICVPYSKFVIDLNPTSALSEGSRILLPYILEKNQEPRQSWLICKDLHHTTPFALENGCIYKIVNALKAKVTITSTNDGSVRAYRRYPSSTDDLEKFQAIGTGQTWAFKNISNGRYLGIPLTIHPPEDGQFAVTTVVTQFTWMVIPNYRRDQGSFKMWAPFVEKVVGLTSFDASQYSGSSLFLTDDKFYDQDNESKVSWRIQYVSGPVAERSVNSGNVTGERDRE